MNNNIPLLLDMTEDECALAYLQLMSKLKKEGLLKKALKHNLALTVNLSSFIGHDATGVVFYSCKGEGPCIHYVNLRSTQGFKPWELISQHLDSQIAKKHKNEKKENISEVRVSIKTSILELVA